MKIALIAAGTLAATTFAGLSGASAKDVNFALTVGGPQGYVQVGSPNAYYGPNYGHKPYSKKHAKKKRRNRKHAKRYWNGNPGYGYGYRAPYPAYGYCIGPYQIRNKLHRHGWNGLKLRKRASQFLIFTGYRYGGKYRLKVDRCSGYVAKVKPVGGYQYGIYW